MLDGWGIGPSLTRGSCRSTRSRRRPSTVCCESSTSGPWSRKLWYWPLLLRELRRADVVHAFSASYASFLLAPLPAVIVAKAAW